MELNALIFILCLLCIARASKVPLEEIEFGAGPLIHIEDPSRIFIQGTDEIDGQSTENPRDKRALGLLLSGLAQVFGYTLTPIQIASLSNPNVTSPAVMSNSPKIDVRQQTASSRLANTASPRQRETIKFTGVLNFGNNSDILGHLQRYEQIFHGRRNNTMMMTTLRPAPIPPTLPAKISVDPRTNTQTRPPLLAPFFVKIPLPIAPDLLPATEDLELLHPPSISMNDLNENTETPVRKEQEVIYRNNEDTERYTVDEKDIYDEKDLKKPMNIYNHQLYDDEPRRNQQQKNRQNELQHKQEERIKKLEQQVEERNCDKPARYNEEKVNERYRHREEEIPDRNQNHVSKHESTEEREQTYDDEEDEGSAERYKEYASQENLSNESSKRPPKKDKKEEDEDYRDDSDKQFNGYKQPQNFDKYVEIEHNQQLPIGDYFHEGNPEMIRDSYGEVLDNKRLEDDRIAGYLSMFKHPYVQADGYDSQRAHSPKDASREENGKETSAEDGYDEHLIRLQKLREEYAPPENKYEEYDLNDENKADRNDRKSGKNQNFTSGKSKRPKPGRDKEDRTRRPTGSNRNDDIRLENVKLQEEVDFERYMPLVVPVRYIDANDKVQQATTQQLNYKETDKSTDIRFGKDNASPTQTIIKEQSLLTPQIGLPERPRQLHEGEHKELQVWPPPFDYVFDNTELASTSVPPNSRNYYPQTYAPNYYQHVVKEIAAQDASDKSSEQPSGYLVVVDNPAHPYRYPYNIYYFSNEAVSSRGQVPHSHAEVTRPRDPVYVAQSASQQIVQAKPNITEYSLNETTSSPRDYYYHPQEIPASVLDRYRYTFEERTPQAKELFNINVRSQIPNTENWSNRIYSPQSPSSTVEQLPRPVFAQLQNIAPPNHNAQSGSSERPRYSRLLRRRKSVQTENNRKNNEEAETPQATPKSKSFNDPQSAHDFFGFSKDDYNFGNESRDATKVTEENGKTAEESDTFVVPEPTAYHHDDESIMKQTDEPENDTEKAKVREYRNKVATLRVSERRQLKPNGPIHYVDFIRNI